MKIGLITASYLPTQIGGAEISARLLAEGLVEKGHEVIILTFDGNQQVEQHINGVKVVRYRRIKGLTDTAQTLTLIPQVFRAIRRWQNEINLFHIYTLFPLPAAGIYKIFGGRRPVVATLNAYSGFCPLSTALCPVDRCNFVQRTRCLAKEKGLISRSLSVPYAAVYPNLISLMKRADRYIALSPTVKELYTEYGYREDKIDVIPNFVEEHIPTSVSMPTGRHDKFNVLYVGRLKQEKGVDILIRAFYEMTKQNSEIRLTIVGDGTETEALKNLVAELNIYKKVVFTGEVSHQDIWQYYRTADVFVHPANWAEPFGRIVLEAMQFRLPLIVSNVGAPPEIVGNAGLVFEKGNVDKLLQKLQLVYKDEKLRHKLSSNCFRILRDYKRDSIINRVIAVYQKALEMKE